jgi:predicted DNA-binding antitoxin AbrB/MazE fold protein
MDATVTAVFEDGVFRPDLPCDLPQGSRVVLAIHGLGEGVAVSADERRAIRRRVVERMKRNPLPGDAPSFKRDDMYDRG